MELFASGVGGFEGSGGVRVISSSAAVWPPSPTSLHEKNLTRFIRFTFTPLHSSGWGGGPDPRTPLASYAAALCHHYHHHDAKRSA